MVYNPSKIRRLALLGGILIGSSASIMLGAASADAAGDPNCPHGGNSTASACFYGSVQYAAVVRYENSTLTVNSSYLAAGYHANESVWLYSGSPCNYWVEEGVTRGYHGLTGYLWYTGQNTSAGYTDYQSATTSPDGSYHPYVLEYAGSNSFNIDRDGSILRTAKGLGSGACVSQSGLELSGGIALSNYTAGTFDVSPLRWEDTAYNVHSGWNAGQFWNDAPCGAGYSSPNCFNGVYYSSTYWADNKP